MSFDLVVLQHVLEHLPDSILAMNQISSLLKVNGYALLEFPNTGSFGYAYKRWFVKFASLCVGYRAFKYPMLLSGCSVDTFAETVMVLLQTSSN